MCKLKFMKYDIKRHVILNLISWNEGWKCECIYCILCCFDNFKHH